MDEDELKQKILEKLEVMENVSLKVLREELEQELGVNLLEQKDFIKKVVTESVEGEEEEKPEPIKVVPVRPPPKIPPKVAPPKQTQAKKRQASDSEDEGEAPKQKKKKLQQTPEGDEYIEVCHSSHTLTISS